MSKLAKDIKTPELSDVHLHLLRIADLNDAQKLDLLNLRNADAVRNNMYDNQPIATDTHVAWCRRVEQSETEHIYIVMRDDRVLGQLAFRAISWVDRRCDWAFYLAGELKGLGIGKRLEFIALRHIFEALEFNKLNCEVIAFNEAVVAMHRRFGFATEGIRREHVYRNGSFHDVVLLGMTAADYSKSNGNLLTGPSK